MGVPPAGSGHSPEGGAAKASPAKPSVPNAVPDEEWIRWGGGECPVPPDTMVDVRWNNRAVSMNMRAGLLVKGTDLWAGPQSGGYIIAYRLAAVPSDPLSIYEAGVDTRPLFRVEACEHGFFAVSECPRFAFFGQTIPDVVGQAVRAIAMETRQGGDVQQAPSRSDDSAGLNEASPKASRT